MKLAEKYGMIMSVIVILVGSLFYFALAEPTEMDKEEKIIENNTTMKTVVIYVVSNVELKEKSEVDSMDVISNENIQIEEEY